MITQKEIIILKKILIELLIERKIGLTLGSKGLCFRFMSHGLLTSQIPHFNFKEAIEFNAFNGTAGYWWPTGFLENIHDPSYDYNNRIDFLNYVINQNVSESKIKISWFDVLKLDWYGLKYWFKVKWAKFRY